MAGNACNPLDRWKQECQKVKIVLGYIMNLRSFWDTGDFLGRNRGAKKGGKETGHLVIQTCNPNTQEC